MDETRLNIEAPLLSVRRCATSSSSSQPKRKPSLQKRHILPYPKSDLTMVQSTEPITVPFNWEHIPATTSSKPHNNKMPPIPRTTTSTTTPTTINDQTKDDDDDVFSDALDTMTPSESFFMNCSESGVSGLELDNTNSMSANKYGDFSTDPKARDFMMDRFLPAAKAMTLQPPQYAASRKQQCLPVEETTREINRSFREEKKILLKKHISDILQSSSHSDSEDDDDDESTHVSAKGCGLFPQLRIKNSLCLLNPVPGVKIRSQLSMPCSFEGGKPNKGSRSYSPAPAVKKAIDAICKSKSSSESAPWEIGEARKKWISQSCRFVSSSGEWQQQQQQQGRISPFRRSRAAATGVSPSRGRPHHPFQSARFNLHTIGHGNSIHQNNNNNNNSAVEKTLYIDTGSTMKLCSSMLDSEETVVDEELDRRSGKEDSSTMLDSSINDDDNTKQIVVVDDGGSVLCPLPPPLPKSPSESWLWRALPLVSVKNPLPLGLGAYSQSKRHDSCTTTSANTHNTKWETIVKTSNLLDDHVRCSQVIQPH